MKMLMVGAALAAGLLAASADAAVLYDNLNTAATTANCSFDTACAVDASKGDDFAAQLFTLGSAATVTSGAFSEIDTLGTTPTGVNWALYADVSGLPSGSALFSGSSTPTATLISTNADDWDFYEESFAISPAALAPGSYFLAIQAVSTNFENYLQEGAVDSGAAETHDGGTTWSSGYGYPDEGMDGVSVALYGSAAVPEPASWALMLAGFGGLGWALRRRAAKFA
ncbi:MAG: PEPxxWA-CTERM sorting domain-containing protein [Caulobacteraceae bacterium]